MVKPTLLYYVHHHGNGHVNNFNLVAPALSATYEIVVISSDSEISSSVDVRYVKSIEQLPKKRYEAGFHHSFTGAFEGVPHNETSHERLAAMMHLIDTYSPAWFISDVSAELAIIARSAGVKTALVRLPGDIGSDTTQVFAHHAAAKLIAFYPRSLESDDYPFKAKTRYLNFHSKYDVNDRRTSSNDSIDVLVGSDASVLRYIDMIQRATDKKLRIIGNRNDIPDNERTTAYGHVDDINTCLQSDIVISAAGLNSVSELITLGKRLVLLPEDRPYDEQKMLSERMEQANLATVIHQPENPADWRQALSKIDSINVPDVAALVNSNVGLDLTEYLNE